MSALSLVAAQENFTATLSAVEDAVKFAFRKRLRRQEYEDALAEAKAAAWSAWHGLIKRGKNPVEVGVHGIATNAIRYVKNRRKIGNTSSGRGCMDIYHHKAQEACGYKLISLDTLDDADVEASTRGSWREWLAEDNRIGPADEACFRVDFAAWLDSLPTRKRQIAELLTEGHEGVVVARLVGLSPGRVCQVRAELEASWREFQGQACVVPSRVTLACEEAPRRRGRPQRPDRDPVEVATRPTL